MRINRIIRDSFTDKMICKFFLNINPARVLTHQSINPVKMKKKKGFVKNAGTI